MAGGTSGEPAIVPGKSADSALVWYVSGLEEGLVMPPRGERLTPAEVSLVRGWIDQGASWPETEEEGWWSLRPLTRPGPPDAKPGTNPIDAFLDRARDQSSPSPALAEMADRRTLVRRLSFDLIGLPPTPEEARAFETDPAPDAYEKLVDRLLASPAFGERWARHWLDVVHFGETHGYDKDQPRPNAWPYRDYVIRAFNSNKPYGRFVAEQVAGDVLFPGTIDGTEALGFIAAGPWDQIGHAEVPETKIDGKVARHLDRDDMVATTINTFVSMTAQCAACHDHKFDPIRQDDYYALQAVFAAVDRADKPYDRDPATRRQREELAARQARVEARRNELSARIEQNGGAELKAIEDRLAELERRAGAGQSSSFGYHAEIETRDDRAKWVQVDLGAAIDLDRVVLSPCWDEFAGIGAGFGMPRTFRVEAADDATFGSGVIVLAEAATDEPAGIAPRVFSARGRSARFVRVTATRLAPRQKDFNFALAELEVFDTANMNRAAGMPVTALDSIEAPPRWSRSNLTDGEAPARGSAYASAAPGLIEAREHLLARVLDDGRRAERDQIAADLLAIERDRATLPAPSLVYAGTVHLGKGAFAGTGGNGGKPRPITVLPRGDVRAEGPLIGPGTLGCVTALPSRFELSDPDNEGQRRAALARWLSHRDNPLTWRSIVNRLWLHHFGRGLAGTPNDFGRMGEPPSHPELLDWLASSLRDDPNQSLKAIHRLIVTSQAYRRRSEVRPDAEPGVDADNHLLARMNRRKLEAEAVRDAILMVAGRLDRTMGGPSFRDFVVTRPEHSPHYGYLDADPDDPATHRRSIYRMIVRSQPQPFLSALDCADPSILVDRRNQTLSPLQALAMRNNALVLVMAKHYAERVEREAGPGLDARIAYAIQLAFQREPTGLERAALVEHARAFGLPSACRVILNLNEFLFVD
jgi:hypothetical protein